jgi:putative nucleotidyltransferase with HDIG domain
MQTGIERLVDLAGRNDLKVPPYPAALARLTRILGRHEYKIAELAKAVASDQALTASILRYANTVRMGGGAPIQSLERAITQIGASEVMRAALAGGLGKVAVAPGPLMALRHRVWLEALLAGGLAQELANLRGLQADIAFLAGLLHDFGKVVLLATLDQGGGEGPRWPAERWFEIIDKHHVDAGVRAAREWKLPPAVVEIIRAHHGNVQIDAGYKPLLQIVQLTDRIIELMNNKSVVSSEDLSKVQGLALGECQRLAHALAGIVDGVASFSEPERSAAPAGPTVSWVEPAAKKDPPAGRVDFAASVERRDGPVLYTAKAIDWQRLIVRGCAPLPENSLVKLTIHVGEDIKIMVNVARSTSEGGEWEVELRPFALGGESKQHYEGIVQKALKGAKA